MAGRVSQEDLEAIIDGDPKARVSQLPLEAIIDGAPAARITQIPLEAIIDGGPNARISQDLLQAIIDAYPNVHISQIVIEVIGLFIEVPMPLVYPSLPGLTYPVGWATDFQNTETQIATDGSEFDLGLSDEPLHTFTLDYELLNDRFGAGQEQVLMRGFFGKHRGNLVRFLYWHREDHQVKSQVIGTTDGTTRIYTLKRTYGVGEASWSEAVGYVDQTMPFDVYLDGTKQPRSSYTIDNTVPVQQQIIFAGIPTTDQVITVDMDYFYYCKFADKNMSLDKFMDALWSGSGIKLRSCRAKA
jgi:hypothetical protein